MSVAPKRKSTGKGSAAKRHGTVLLGAGDPIEGQGNTSSISIPRPLNARITCIRHFRKMHRFSTYGLAYNIIDFKKSCGVTDKGEDQYIMSTPLAFIPWDWDFFYLNYSEWRLLPPGARCKQVKCEIYSENYEIESPAKSVVYNENKLIRTGLGLLQNIPSLNVSYTEFETNNPMKPTILSVATIDDVKEMAKKMYGSDDSSDLIIPYSQFGSPIQCINYLGVSYSPSHGSEWPCLQSYVTELRANDCQGKKILDVTYEPSCGLLTFAQRNFYSGNPLGVADHNTGIAITAGSVSKGHETTVSVKTEEGTSEAKNTTGSVSIKGHETTISVKTEEGTSEAKNTTGSVSIKGHETTVSVKSKEGTTEKGTSEAKNTTGSVSIKRHETTVSVKTEEGTSEAKSTTDPSNFNYIKQIEKCQFLTRGLNDQFEIKSQPSLHIGIQPVPYKSTRNRISGNVPNWSVARADFRVRAEMIVEANH
ncbi:uncharacterized protein NPIL_36911 [Nephila pilipes]|uniref:Capsid protein n=1 Tax=Nephila pilipes TaxID=299642 RepID=A0A8X6NTC3_NEPPI|nr:uncharacterized protein NPIL_36911 [Nephila pilipes]